MCSKLPVIDLSNHIAKPMQPFFSEENPKIPPEIVALIFSNFNALELSFLQKVSWSWRAVIRTYFHEKIMKVKEFFITHYIGKTFQNLTNKDVVLFSEVENFLYSIPPELISRFAYIQDFKERTPLIYAVYAKNIPLIRLLIESLPEDKREAYIESKGVSALSLAQFEVMQGNPQFFSLLVPYLKSKMYIMGMLMDRKE